MTQSVNGSIETISHQVNRLTIHIDDSFDEFRNRGRGLGAMIRQGHDRGQPGVGICFLDIGQQLLKCCSAERGS